MTIKTERGGEAGWTFSPQVGSPSHCDMAQVWDEAGKSVAVIEPTEDPDIATGRARYFAAVHDMREALEWALDRLGQVRLVRGQNDEYFAAHTRARAALAKAKGEP